MRRTELGALVFLPLCAATAISAGSSPPKPPIAAENKPDRSMMCGYPCAEWAPDPIRKAGFRDDLRYVMTATTELLAEQCVKEFASKGTCVVDPTGGGPGTIAPFPPPGELRWQSLCLRSVDADHCFVGLTEGKTMRSGDIFAHAELPRATGKATP